MTTVAIIDDDTQAANAVRYNVEDAGFTPWMFPGRAETLDGALNQIKENAQAAICDHRLSPLGLANFDGAELAARLIADQIPAVLISQFVNQDYDVSIRRWRAKIPSLLSRDECRPETIKDALELCRREISGEIFAGRRKHRTLLRIADMQTEGNEEVIDAILPAWNRQRAVRFPAILIPSHLRRHLENGVYLIAYVNLAATRPEDLFLESFEQPSPLDENSA
jgi:DNA-binding NarL/FixJ family response regulator